MSRLKLSGLVLGAVLVLAACSGGDVAQFWRPISEPNLQMPLNDAQIKLEYDLAQCNCGIFPRNVPRNIMAQIDRDKQRLNETGVVMGDEKGQCVRKPSLEVAECMRARGWETTNCSGRMPVAGGGAVCATYEPQ